jgi:hypothetical protein
MFKDEDAAEVALAGAQLLGELARSREAGGGVDRAHRGAGASPRVGASGVG